MKWWTIGLASMLLALGCDPMPVPQDASVDAGVEPMLEVGAGMDRFASFEDGDTLQLVSGCQGLQHVWVALRAWGIDRRGTILNLEAVRDRDGQVVSQIFNVRVSLQPVEGADYTEVTGLTLVIPEPDEALGEDLTLRVVVTERAESGGRVLEGARPFRLEWGTMGCGGTG